MRLEGGAHATQSGRHIPLSHVDNPFRGACHIPPRNRVKSAELRHGKVGFRGWHGACSWVGKRASPWLPIKEN